MGNTGVGMLLGETSVKAWYLLFLGVVILGIAIWYGVRRSGHLRRGERVQLDRNTEAAQHRDDPQKPVVR